MAYHMHCIYAKSSKFVGNFAIIIGDCVIITEKLLVYLFSTFFIFK